MPPLDASFGGSHAACLLCAFSPPSPSSLSIRSLDASFGGSHAVFSPLFWLAICYLLFAIYQVPLAIPITRRVRQETRRSRGRSMEEILERLSPVIVGWVNYFALADAKGHMERLDE